MSGHVILNVINSSMDLGGDCRADPVTLADVSAYKAFLTDDLGMGISESWNFIDVPLTAENGFIDVDPTLTGYQDYETYVSELV